MLVVLTGKSGSGKDTVARFLEKEGFEKIISYTTRPMREGEVNGTDYHFVTQDEFNKLRKSGRFAESYDYHAKFGDCSYGSLEEDYRRALTEDKKRYVILTPEGFSTVRKNIPAVTGIYLDVPERVLRKRLTARAKKEPDLEKREVLLAEIDRRLKSDKERFFKLDHLSNKGLLNYGYARVTVSGHTSPARVAEKVLFNVYSEKKPVFLTTIKGIIDGKWEEYTIVSGGTAGKSLQKGKEFALRAGYNKGRDFLKITVQDYYEGPTGKVFASHLSDVKLFLGFYRDTYSMQDKSYMLNRSLAQIK